MGAMETKTLDERWITSRYHAGNPAPAPAQGLAAHPSYQARMHEWLRRPGGIVDDIVVEISGLGMTGADGLNVRPTDAACARVLWAIEMLVTRLLRRHPRWDKSHFWALAYACAARVWLLHQIPPPRTSYNVFPNSTDLLFMWINDAGAPDGGYIHDEYAACAACQNDAAPLVDDALPAHGWRPLCPERIQTLVARRPPA